MLSRKIKTLANGLRIVAVEMPHLHGVEIAFYIKAGGRNDPHGKEGISHFVEHMLFRGTAEHSTTLELEMAFEGIGGSVNASTDEESTCYFTRVHPDHVSQGIKLFSSLILRPTLPGIEIEKRIITEEALEDMNERGKEINTHNLASRLLWPGHSLGAPTIGYLSTIAGFTDNDLKGYMAELYRPNNTVAVIAGDIRAETVFTACEEAFSAWHSAPLPHPVPPSVSQTSPEAIFVDDSDSQVHLHIAFRGFARSDPRLMAIRLIRRALCGSGCSRLNLRLREQLGIVYSVDATISAYEETGTFGIELSTTPENLPVAVNEVLNAVLRISVENIHGDELQRIKKGYFFDLEYSRDSCYEMQVRYGWGELMGLVHDIEDDQAEAEALDSETVRLTAAALFAPHNLNLVAVGPLKNPLKKAVEKILAEYEQKWQVVS